ncbi:hypothetical protein OROHE_022583 [Orobanche hederae]
MGGSQKSKRVAWASDVNLCQVRIGTQDHLQAKALWSVQTGDMGSDVNLPPGFEGLQPASPWTAKLSQIPLIKWRYPPRFVVDIAWQVVAGDESLEIEMQNQREMRVLEAIYPRPSSIPPNPSTFVAAEDPTNHDQRTPVVPITPIEDEDAAIDTSSYASPTAVNTNPMIFQPQQANFSSQVSSAIINPHQPNGISTIGRVEPDAVAAALTSVISNSKQGNTNTNNLIDSGLLIKILRDPKMIEQLMTNLQASSSSPSTQNIPSSGLQVPPAVGSRNHVPPPPDVPSSSSMRNNAPSTSGMQYTPNSRYPPLSQGPTAASRPMQPGPLYPPPSPPVTKDLNYYKSLIQQHGAERRESSSGPQVGRQTSQEHVNVVMKPRESKPKIMKPCIYFNSSKGCRNGADCSYQHDISAQQRVVGGGIREVQSAKRAKVDREITGS